MKYLNVILTIIAILLTLHLIKPFFISTATASKWQNVNLVAIEGKPIKGTDMFDDSAVIQMISLPVRIID